MRENRCGNSLSSVGDTLHTAQMFVLMVFCGPQLPLAFLFVCGPVERGPQTNWKANGRFPFVWLRRRRRSRDTVQIVVFVGTLKLLETIVNCLEFCGYQNKWFLTAVTQPFSFAKISQRFRKKVNYLGHHLQKKSTSQKKAFSRKKLTSFAKMRLTSH